MAPRKHLWVLATVGTMALACQPATDTSVPPPPPAPPPPPPPPPPVNHAPVAKAGGPYNTETGVIAFDGSASSDSDGDALTYAWQFGDGGTSSNVKGTHTYVNPGPYTVTLIVTDSKGLASAPDSAAVTVALAPVIMGAGNIASCGSNNDLATAAIIANMPNAQVFTLGDNVFPQGTADNYTNCYGPTWGQFLDRTHAVFGNHEYDLGNADAAFAYFGDHAGPKGLGYYSYELGNWHIIVLNDHGGASIDTAQMTWLQSDLAADTKPCTLAMWHVPLFLSSHTAGWNVNPEHKPIWDALYAANVDVVLNGQQHNYERFAPMTPSGDVDTTRGIRQFSVGTGGESVDNFEVVHPHSEIQAPAASFGVLKLTLKHNGYDWQFIPAAGVTFTDSGSGSCH